MGDCKELFVRCQAAFEFHTLRVLKWDPPKGQHRGVVVCMHGLTRNALDFQRFAPRFAAAGYLVYSVDTAGRGGSDHYKTTDSYQYPVYVNDMAMLLGIVYPAHKEHELGPLIWIGTSMGGLTGMMLAGMGRSPIDLLVLNDIGPEISYESLVRLSKYVCKSMHPQWPCFRQAVAYFKSIYGQPFGQTVLAPAEGAAPGPDGKEVDHLYELTRESVRVWRRDENTESASSKLHWNGTAELTKDDLLRERCHARCPCPKDGVPTREAPKQFEDRKEGGGKTGLYEWFEPHFDVGISEPFGKYMAKEESKNKPMALWPIWSGVQCPTLVFRGAVSDLLTSEVVEKMLKTRAQAISKSHPKAKVEVLEQRVPEVKKSHQYSWGGLKSLRTLECDGDTRLTVAEVVGTGHVPPLRDPEEIDWVLGWVNARVEQM